MAVLALFPGVPCGSGTPTILFCDVMLRVFSSGGFFVDVDMA